MYVKRLIPIIILSLISSVGFAGSLEKAQKIASLIANEQQYVAIMASRKDEIAERVKAALAGKVDISDISDKDFDTFMDVYTDESAKGMTAGLRWAFAKKFSEEMNENDLDIMLKCFSTNVCERSGYSPSGMKALLGLQQYGAKEGARLGQTIGTLITPKLIEIVEANANNRFDNPASVLKMLRSNVDL